MMQELPLLPHNQDVLIIVPPFVRPTAPSLAAHLLQACAKKAGFRVSILYANLSLAALIGLNNYQAIDGAATTALLGERFFAASAYGLPPLGYEPEKMFDFETSFNRLPAEARLDPPSKFNRHRQSPWFNLDLVALKTQETQIGPWADAIARAVVDFNPGIVGCTTTFQQTAASVALIKRIKHLSPQTITIIGGANCTGEMAEGMANLSAGVVDYIFSGESEATFVDFLGQVKAGQRPAKRIIYAQPCRQLDALPRPDYTEYRVQLEHFLPQLAAKPDLLEVVYESSRGCWWGRKHPYTFSGLNDLSMAYRMKSSHKVIDDLKHLQHQHPSWQVTMADDMMPQTYLKTLLPRLAAEIPGLRLTYMLKTNLSLARVMLLKQAGVVKIQLGGELLSSLLFKRMDKGVSARQNIALLRYARSANLEVSWSLIWGFPGDRAEEYREILALLPLLRHLKPPRWLAHLSIDRSSPYFEHPADYGVSRLHPWDSYIKLLPDWVDPAQVACYFAADYRCGSHHHHELIREIQHEVTAWQAAWQANVSVAPTAKVPTPPVLTVTHEVGGHWLLHDTRGLPDTEEYTRLTRPQTSLALVSRPLALAGDVTWALERKVGVILNGWYVPLATAEPALLQAFEAERELGFLASKSQPNLAPNWVRPKFMVT